MINAQIPASSAETLHCESDRRRTFSPSLLFFVLVFFLGGGGCSRFFPSQIPDEDHNKDAPLAGALFAFTS